MPWDLSHRVERQKLTVTTREEMSVRVWKGGFVANLLLRLHFRPNVLLEKLYNHILKLRTFGGLIEVLRFLSYEFRSLLGLSTGLIFFE